MNTSKVLPFAVCLLLIILVEPFYRQYLFEASIPIIIMLQASATPELILFFQTVSSIGAMGLIIGVLVISYIWWSRS